MRGSTSALCWWNRGAALRGRRMSGTGQNASGSMMSFQDSLPHLPVPDLAKSLEKYVSAVTPLVGAKQLAKTQRIVKEFGQPGSVGEQLQQKLVERAKTTENWLADWWLNCTYLGYRLPIVIHSSPGTVYPYLDKPHSVDQQLQVIAKNIFSSAKFKDMVDSETLPVPGAPKMPICMSQFPKIFSSCRVPAIPVDKTVYFKPEEGQHVVVAHNNLFYHVPVYKDGHRLSPTQVYALLKKVVRLSPEEESPPIEERIGLLSAGHRDTWARHYQELMKDPVNAESIQKIESAMLLVAFDKPNSEMANLPEGNVEERVHTAHRILHGGGASMNSGNRWFDKVLQLTVAPDGGYGCYLEHSHLDGVSAILLTEHNLAFSRDTNEVLVEDATCENLPAVHRLEWRLTDSLRSAITSAGCELNTLVDRLGICCCFFRRFGHAFVKACGFSSDSIMQLAIQVTHFRMYGWNAPTYESCSTGRFKYGRTDTIRSATVESDAFVRAIDQQSLPVSEKARLMITALKKHTELVQQASSGEAFDRHLFGLRMIAAKHGLPTPKIFTDPTYTEINHFRLSTSQVRSQFRLHFVFSPVVDDGYGIAYLIRPEEITFTVTAFNDCATTDHKRFAAVLESSLNDLHDILTSPTLSKL